jgi:CMP-N-acetylneuraminic acid synthetase
VTASVVALVPMRHDSERVPGKNYRPFDGRPLYHHVVGSLLACPSITTVVIDTDSDVIAADAAVAFPQVRVIDRPGHLTDGRIPMNDVLLNDVSQVAGDYYLQTHSTNPLLMPETIEAAITTFLRAVPRHDSLFSVTRLHKRFWTEDGRPMNHDPSQLLRTQDLPPVLEENSCLYLFSRAGLEKHGSRIGERPLPFAIPSEEAWDIDEEVDFLVTEFLYQHRARRS